MVVLSSSFSLLQGLQTDVSCDDPESIVPQMTNGVYLNGNMVYYLQSTRKPALELLRAYISGYMNQCIDEHNNTLETARMAWKQCK
jgi:hypothetical protein